eukprot:scaffold736_cov254-Pinguiococcus_pyrenoidosus.AAC.26
MEVVLKVQALHDAPLQRREGAEERQVQHAGQSVAHLLLGVREADGPRRTWTFSGRALVQEQRQLEKRRRGVQLLRAILGDVAFGAARCFGREDGAHLRWTPNQDLAVAALADHAHVVIQRLLDDAANGIVELHVEALEDAVEARQEVGGLVSLVDAVEALADLLQAFVDSRRNLAAPVGNPLFLPRTVLRLALRELEGHQRPPTPRVEEAKGLEVVALGGEKLVQFHHVVLRDARVGAELGHAPHERVRGHDDGLLLRRGVDRVVCRKHPRGEKAQRARDRILRLRGVLLCGRLLGIVVRPPVPDVGGEMLLPVGDVAVCAAQSTCSAVCAGDTLEALQEQELRLRPAKVLVSFVQEAESSTGQSIRRGVSVSDKAVAAGITYFLQDFGLAAIREAAEVVSGHELSDKVQLDERQSLLLLGDGVDKAVDKAGGLVRVDAEEHPMDLADLAIGSPADFGLVVGALEGDDVAWFPRGLCALQRDSLTVHKDSLAHRPCAQPLHSHVRLPLAPLLGGEGLLADIVEGLQRHNFVLRLEPLLHRRGDVHACVGLQDSASCDSAGHLSILAILPQPQRWLQLVLARLQDLRLRRHEALEGVLGWRRQWEVGSTGVGAVLRPVVQAGGQPGAPLGFGGRDEAIHGPVAQFTRVAPQIRSLSAERCDVLTEWNVFVSSRYEI